VVLDEATSLIGLETEKKITDLVEEKFRDRTFVAVAHRLHAFRHFDVIVVMGGGSIVDILMSYCEIEIVGSDTCG
jgi:ATP-binding cassette subfamily B protein